MIKKFLSSIVIGLLALSLLPPAWARRNCAGGPVDYELEIADKNGPSTIVRLTQFGSKKTNATWQMEDPDGLISLALMTKSLERADQVHRQPMVTSYLSALVKLQQRLPATSPAKDKLTKLIRQIVTASGTQGAQISDESLRMFREEIYPPFRNRQIFATLKTADNPDVTRSGTLENQVPVGFFDADFSSGACESISTSVASPEGKKNSGSRKSQRGGS